MCIKWNTEAIRSYFFYDQPRLHAHYSPLNSHVLLGIRIIGALYLTGFYIFDFLDSQTLINRIIYLTNVGYFLTWLYFITILQSRLIKCASGLDNYCQILFQTVFCAQVFITIMYWSVLYTSKVAELDFPIFNNVNWHGVPLFFLLLDFIFCSYRFIPSQFYTFLVFTFIYMIIFNMPYSLGVRPVYGKASDWVGWITYALIAAAIIIAGIVFIIGRVIFKKCKQQKIETNNQKTQLQKCKQPNKTNNISQTQNVKNLPMHIELG